MRPWFRNFLAFVISIVVVYVLAFAIVDLVEAIAVGFYPEQSRAVDTRGFGAQIAEIDRGSAQIAGIDRRYEPPDVSRTDEIANVLDHVTAFNNLAFSGDDLVDQALTYLAEPGHTPLERRIAILAVQKVPVAQWVRFANKMLDMYDSRQVDLWEMYDAIYPRRFYSNHPEDDFWRPGVRHVLYRLYCARDIHSFMRESIVFDLLGVSRLPAILFTCGRCA